jgi:hypothetical protein
MTTDNTAEDFFTRKHARLANIASATNTFAWIALVFQILYMGARLLQYQNSYTMQNMASGLGQPNFMEMLSQNPLYTFSLVVDLANIFLRAVMWWLALKGISLGLYMIIETNLNYEDKFEGGEANNE